MKPSTDPQSRPSLGKGWSRLVTTVALVFGIVQAVALPARAQVTADSQHSYAHAIEQGQRILPAFIEEVPMPGLSVAVAVDGKIVWSEGFGYANLETRQPVTPLTKFRIASVSKPITAAAAGLLAEQGILDLEAPIQNYVPEFPDKGAPITASQLARHLGGVRHTTQAEVLSTKHYPTTRSAVAMFADDDLLFAPGESRSYTTLGYTLLGAAMASAAETDFATLMRERVFEPLGMRHTLPDNQQQIIPNRSGLYAYDNDEDLNLINAPLTDHSYKIPGGGFLSTAEDLVRFGSALLEPGFLNRESLDLIFSPSQFNDGKTHNYSMGWTIREDNHDRQVYGHGGNQPGGRCYLLLYPDSGVVIAMLTNVYRGVIGRAEAQLIAEPFVRIKEGHPPQSRTIDPEGTYELVARRGLQKANGIISIWEVRDRLEGSLAFEGRQHALPLIAVSGNQIRAMGYDKRLMVFNMTVEDGKVTGNTVNGSRPPIGFEGVKLDE